MLDNGPKKQSLGARLGFVFRSKGSGKKLKKQKDVDEDQSKNFSGGKPRLQHGAIYKPDDNDTNIQTGERRDDTDLLHGLVYHESNESLDMISAPQLEIGPTGPPGEAIISTLPPALWDEIASYLTPCDAANLALSSKILADRLGPHPWLALNHPENREEKIKFLLPLDRSLPGHLFCFGCVAYHLRTQPGKERLKADLVTNPIVKCPSIGKPGYKPPRIRLTPGYTIPFTFVQLALRSTNYSTSHGVPLDSLNRRWKDPNSEWSHQARYYIYKGHLLLRVSSKTFAPPGLPVSGQRHLLYSREDYTPYFSVCTHWRDGELMNICKCALGHIPEYKQSIGQQLQHGPRIQMALRNIDPIVSLCSQCRPMRRCPECPTEYLVELKLAEDKNDPLVKFKQAIVVTRWSDLGDGSSPSSTEWAAINGEVEYDSFGKMGRRAISGIFESQSGVTIPGQRMLSLNPNKEKLGEDGHNWY